MRLQNKLFLALTASSVLLVLLMLALMQWSVARGMLDYVNTREAAQLQPVLDSLAKIYSQEDGWGELQSQPQRLELLLRSTRNAWRRPAGLPPADPSPPHRRPPEFKSFTAPGAGRPGGGPRLLDGERNIVIGETGDIAAFRTLPIELDGGVVGWLAMPPRRKITDGYELRFLEQQWQTLVAIGIIVMVLALLVSYLLSRHLLKPIASLAEANELIRQGDFTPRLQVDRKDELGRLARDFNELAESLQHSDSARRRWFADVSHELRTPLAILYAQLEAMLDGVRPLDRQGLQSLQQELVHLNTLVEDLYTLSSADLGSLHYHKEDMDLGELLREVVAMHQASMCDAGLTLSLTVPAVAVQVRADRTRLCQLLDNLLVNSRKYTTVGGEVRVNMSAADSQAKIVVEDSAPEVPSEALGSLFDHLYRVEGSRNRSTGGSGLGLSICQRIVTAHGGSIKAEASALGGLAVTIQLPLL